MYMYIVYRIFDALCQLLRVYPCTCCIISQGVVYDCHANRFPTLLFRNLRDIMDVCRLWIGKYIYIVHVHVHV